MSDFSTKLNQYMELELSKNRLRRLFEFETQMRGEDMAVEKYADIELSGKYDDLYGVLLETIKAEAKYLAEL